jgi:hypothetical protein
LYQGAKIVKRNYKKFSIYGKNFYFRGKKFRFMDSKNIDSKNAKETTEKVVRKIKEIRRQKSLSRLILKSGKGNHKKNLIN